MSVKFPIYALNTHGEVLSTRPLGRDIGREIHDRLLETSALMISFAGVEVASAPFLDEVVRAVRGTLAGGEANRLVAVVALNEDVQETLNIVLDKNKMSLASLDEGKVELLGGNEMLRETLDAAVALGERFTAPELAERLRIKLPALHQRLKPLLDTGVLAREPDETAERGKRHRYRSPQQLTPA